MYTGTLPTPMAVRFATSALRIQFLSQEGNRDTGFVLQYLADGSCYRNCGGRGTCVQGLCQCDAGRAGADCSIVVPQLSSGQRVTGRVFVGQTAYYRVEVPTEPAGLMMLVELTFPDGAIGGKPLLTLANASRPLVNMQHFLKRVRQPVGS